MKGYRERSRLHQAVVTLPDPLAHQQRAAWHSIAFNCTRLACCVDWRAGNARAACPSHQHLDDQLETSSSRYGGAPIADIARAIRYAVAASGCSTLAETDRGGTFSNRGPNPSAMVGCVRIASRSV